MQEPLEAIDTFLGHKIRTDLERLRRLAGRPEGGEEMAFDPLDPLKRDLKRLQRGVGFVHPSDINFALTHLASAIKDEQQAALEYQDLADAIQAWVGALPQDRLFLYQDIVAKVRAIRQDELRHHLELSLIRDRLKGLR